MEPKEQKQAIGSVSFGGISVSSDIYIRSDTHIRIKLCGLSRVCDIEAANELKPDYIGFVFAPGSRRYVPPCRARELKEMLLPGIQTVGVFVREDPEVIAGLLDDGIIDLAQLQPEALDMPFGLASGAGAIFGVTGGVTEAVLRRLVK